MSYLYFGLVLDVMIFMADTISKQKRSQIMASITGKETGIEVQTRSFLFREGFRFRKNETSLPGKPDVVLPKYKTVIFIHGCFWHGHTNCTKGRLPKSNIEFWKTKIDKNAARDRRVRRELRQLGWKTITVWGCKLKNAKLFAKEMAILVKKIKEITLRR